MKFFIIGWLVLSAVGIAMHFLVFEQLEKDYINVKNVYQTRENTQVVEFLQQSHYIVSPKIEHYIGSSSVKPVTPQQVCDSINLTTNRLSQIPTFSTVGKIFETKLKNNNAEALAICNNSNNLTNSDNFFKMIAPSYLMQQTELYWMRSFSVSKRNYNGRTEKNMRYWIEYTVGGLVLLGAMVCYMAWKKE